MSADTPMTADNPMVGDNPMKRLLTSLGQHVRAELLAYEATGRERSVHGDSPGGDAQFDVDEVAEQAVLDYLREHAHVPAALYTEDGSYVELAPDPQVLLVVDPIDGTRPTSAGLEMGMVSIAAAPMGTASPPSPTSTPPAWSRSRAAHGSTATTPTASTAVDSPPRSRG